MSLRAGELRHRITFSKQKRVMDQETGLTTLKWLPVAGLENVPAKVTPSSVREFIAAQQLTSVIVAYIVIRPIAGITPDMRIEHGTTIYGIAGALPDPDSGQEYVTIPCTSGGDGS